MTHPIAPALTDADSSAVARAEELLATDWAAAVEVLDAARRRAGGDRLAIELTRLRHLAGLQLAAEAVAGARPEPGTVPPLGDSGLPEVRPSELTAPTLRAAILAHGCLLVRGIVDEERGRSLAASIDRAFAAREAGAASRPPDSGPPHRSGWYSPLPLPRAQAEALGRKFTMATSGLLLCDSPLMMAEVLDLYTALGLDALATEFLGGRPVLSANKCSVRRVSLETKGGWHQDGRFLGAGIRALNLWLALTPCGVDAPGLDVVPRRLDAFVDAGTTGADFDWAASDVIARDAAGPGGVVRPRFEVGDMLLFDEMMLHRTAMSPAMTRERHAIETWCFAGAAYPSGHVPVAW